MLLSVAACQPFTSLAAKHAKLQATLLLALEAQDNVHNFKSKTVTKAPPQLTQLIIVVAGSWSLWPAHCGHFFTHWYN